MLTLSIAFYGAPQPWPLATGIGQFFAYLTLKWCEFGAKQPR